MAEKILPSDLNPEVTYKGILRDFKENLKEIKSLKEVYIDSGEITEEELNIAYPEIEEDIVYLEHMVSKLKDNTIKDWFVKTMNEKIQDKVTSEDLEIIAAGLIAQKNLEGIFEGGLKDLLEFISPEGDKTKMLN